MNATTEKNWAELKGKIKSKWGKFNDEEVESVKNDLSQLSGKIQKAYGIGQDQAERQYDEFKKSVLSLTEHDTPAPNPAVVAAIGPATTPAVSAMAEPALAIKPRLN